MILLFIPVHFDGVFTLFCFKIDSTKAIVGFVVRVLFLFLQSLFCIVCMMFFKSTKFCRNYSSSSQTNFSAFFFGARSQVFANAQNPFKLKSARARE